VKEKITRGGEYVKEVQEDAPRGWMLRKGKNPTLERPKKTGRGERHWGLTRMGEERRSLQKMLQVKGKPTSEMTKKKE